jgi:hypothetical protein
MNLASVLSWDFGPESDRIIRGFTSDILFSQCAGPIISFTFYALKFEGLLNLREFHEVTFENRKDNNVV